jgi:hypothetical protein
MSRIKELKINPDNNLNLVEVLQMICPEGKTKYVELLLRLTKNTKNLDRFVEEIRENLKNSLELTDDAMDQFTPFQLLMAYRFLDQSFNFSDLKLYKKFCEYNERGLISNNDLTRFSSFEDIMTATGMAEMRANEKDLEKQIKVIYSDDEWVVLRPLTYHSSLKYGSSTKWCTSSENNPDYFLRYVKRGILLYMINKVNGLKVACFKSLDNSEPEFSFWNQIDARIDSMESGLPTFIMEVIRDEVNTNSVTNYSLLSDEDKIKLEEIVHPKKNRRIERAMELVTDAPEENESMAMMGEPMIQESVMEERGMEEIRSERGYDEDLVSMALPEPQDEVQSERSYDESPTQERGW